MSRATFPISHSTDVWFNPQERARPCCEKIIASFLLLKEEELRSNVTRRRQGTKRETRAAFADAQSDVNSGSLAENSPLTASVPTLNTSALPDAVGSRQADSQDPSGRTTSVVASDGSHTANAHRPAAERLWPGHELNHSGSPEAAALSTGFSGPRPDNGDIQANKEAGAGSSENANEDEKERDVEPEQTGSRGEAHHSSGRTGLEPVEPSESEPSSQPQLHHHIPNNHDCDGCRPGEHCECNRERLALAGPPMGMKGFPKRPRTDEAVWAAAALGSLLVLLALAVLHTRLYRHWRTTPSLYWYDPQQDYESVAGEEPFGQWNSRSAPSQARRLISDH